MIAESKHPLRQADLIGMLPEEDEKSAAHDQVFVDILTPLLSFLARHHCKQRAIAELEDYGGV